MLNVADPITTDVLVIGGGGAGLRAAIEARRQGADVLLVSKTPVGYANNTAIALGAFAAATGGRDARDSPAVHLKDTVAGGRFMNDQVLVEVMTTAGKGLVDDMSAMGVQFRKRDGLVGFTQVSGHTYPRTVATEKGKGLGLTRPLRAKALELGVRFQEGVLVASLATSGGAVVGAIGLDDTGRLVPYRARATVIATGGAGQIYDRNDNARGIAGDGYLLAYDLGLPLADMEFVQFERSASAEPGETPVGMLFEALVLNIGAVLRNSLDEDILEKHGCSGPLRSTRDRVSRAIMKEVKEGRGVDGAAVYDLSRISQADLEKVYPILDRRTVEKLARGERRLRMLPIAHFFMGGVCIDQRCATALEGLYAAGEVTAGVHGANRLGSNALTEIFVFGAIAGREAAEHAQKTKRASVARSASRERERLGVAVGSQGGRDIEPLRDRLRRMMWQHCGILRDESRLKEGLRQLEGMQRDLNAIRVDAGPDLLRRRETEFMVTTAEMVLKAALKRTESRGAHYREDHPEEDNERWLQNIVITKKHGAMDLSLRPVALTKVPLE